MKSGKQVNFKILFVIFRLQICHFQAKVSQNKNGLFQAPVYSFDPILDSSTISARNNYECNIIAQSHALPITKKMRSSMF